MIKVEIRNELNDRSFGGQFESKALADKWIAKCKEKGSWGEVGDYVVTVKNLNLSKIYRNQKKVDSRKSEYPSMEEILHILMDHGLESEEMISLQADRLLIKLKYPLE